MTTTLSFHDFSDLELLSEGCSSLITYCTQVLHLSEHAAYNRIEAPRAARRFPQILERLADGSIHLTAVRLLAPALTPENHRALLDAARHKSKRDIEHLLAQLNPEPDVASSIRKLPAPAASPLVTDVPPLMELPAAAQLVAKRIPAATSLTPRPWQSSSEGSSRRRSDAAPLQRHQPHRNIFPQLSNVTCGRVTAAGARLSAPSIP